MVVGCRRAILALTCLPTCPWFEGFTEFLSISKRFVIKPFHYHGNLPTFQPFLLTNNAFAAVAFNNAIYPSRFLSSALRRTSSYAWIGARLRLLCPSPYTTSQSPTSRSTVAPAQTLACAPTGMLARTVAGGSTMQDSLSVAPAWMVEL